MTSNRAANRSNEASDNRVIGEEFIGFDNAIKDQFNLALLIFISVIFTLRVRRIFLNPHSNVVRPNAQMNLPQCLSLI